MTDLSAILRALFGEEPFFGGNTFGYQSDCRRHIFMNCALQLAIVANRPVRVLEIGSWIGSSALSFAQGIRRFSPQGGSILCVDPWDSYVEAEEVKQGGIAAAMDELAKSGLAYHLFLHNTRSIRGHVSVDHLRGTSADLVARYESGHFDMIYVDGCHYYDEAMQDLRICARLLRDGGILCGDDLEAQVGVVPERYLLDKKRMDYVRMVPPGMDFHPGLTLAVHHFFRRPPDRLIRTFFGFWLVKKSGDRFDDVSLAETVPLIPDHFAPDMKQRCRDLILSIEQWSGSETAQAISGGDA